MRRAGPFGPIMMLAMPVIEIVLIIWVASLIGWGWTFVALLVSFGAGLAVMRWAGLNAFRALSNPQHAYTQVDPNTGEQQRIYPTGQNVDVAEAIKDLRSSGLLFVAGVLLAVPGFVTTILGLLLLPPFVRTLIGSRMGEPKTAGATVVGETVIVEETTTEATEQDSPGEQTSPPPAIEGIIIPPQAREDNDR